MYYQGLTFAVAVTVAVGTALYYLITSQRQQTPQNETQYTQDYPPVPRRVMRRRLSNDRSTNRSRSASSNVTDRSDGQQDVCCICLSSLRIGVQVLSCSHRFHRDCIQSWFSTDLSCPICRVFFN